MPAWPSNLDYEPLNSSLVHVFDDKRIRTGVEQSIARHRSAYSAALHHVQMSWMMSPSDMETFRIFYDDTVNGGVTPFTMPIFTGSAYTNVTVNFIKGSDSYERAEQEWKVSAAIETAPLPVMTSAALDAIIGAATPGALPSWPAQWLPNPLERDVKLSVPQVLIRSDLEDGLQPQARPFMASPAFDEITLPMVNATFDAFRAWRIYRIYNGEGWFSMPVFRGGSYETHNVRIVAQSLKATRDGYDWLTHMKLEMRDLPAL